MKREFYKENRDIFYLEETDTWYRKGSVKIDYDWEKNQVYLKDTVSLCSGIVNFDEKNQIVHGKFTKNPYNNCTAHTPDGRTFTAISAELLLEHGYFEDVERNEFYHKASLSTDEYRSRIRIRPGKSYTNKGYNIEDNKDEFKDKIKLYANYPLKINEDARTYGKFLGITSLGAEIETCVGSVGDWVQNRHGLVTCRDGSLEGGGEFVTVPMTGAKAIQNLIEISKEMKNRCQIDIKCAYHLHLGTLPTERVFLTALYMLSYQIQDDVFKMFPGYKLDPRDIKRKNYCQKLPQMSIYPLKDQSKLGYEQFVDSVYGKIFEFLSDGHAADLDVNRKQQRHPIERKYERSSRYFWENFQNLLFSPRQTTEFRIASPTLNSQRFILWLMICNAICKYAEYNMKKIITGEAYSFQDVLNVYQDHWKNDKDASFLSKYLSAYYDERCKAFQKDKDAGNRLSEWEISKDSSYKFSFENKSLFVN